MSTVSVIVPVYNAEKYLHRCIDSLLAQSFTDFELILVDDGSPDNCPAICDDYAVKDPRVVVIHKENGGVSSARNSGLEIARGKYVTFVDSDDYVSETFLENLLPGDCDLSICGFSMVDPNGTVSHSQEYFLSGNFPVTPDNIGQWYDGGYLYSVWRCMFDNSILRKYRFRFDSHTSRGEDTIFVLTYLEHCKTVTFCPDILYHYIRYSSGTLTTNCRPENLCSLAYLDNFLCRWFDSNSVISKRFESPSYWTRKELREQFYGTLGNPDRSFREKYALVRAFCQIPEYSFFLRRFLNREHPKYQLLMKTRCSALILLYHTLILKN